MGSETRNEKETKGRKHRSPITKHPQPGNIECYKKRETI